jgi:hypothetical protein
LAFVATARSAVLPAAAGTCEFKTCEPDISELNTGDATFGALALPGNRFPTSAGIGIFG